MLRATAYVTILCVVLRGMAYVTMLLRATAYVTMSCRAYVSGAPLAQAALGMNKATILAGFQDLPAATGKDDASLAREGAEHAAILGGFRGLLNPAAAAGDAEEGAVVGADGPPDGEEALGFCCC